MGLRTRGTGSSGIGLPIQAREDVGFQNTATHWKGPILWQPRGCGGHCDGRDAKRTVWGWNAKCDCVGEGFGTLNGCAAIAIHGSLSYDSHSCCDPRTSAGGGEAPIHQVRVIAAAGAAVVFFFGGDSMECVVQGILEAKHVDALEVLLQGLCGGLRETIKVHEICLKTGPNLGAVASEVYLCCSLSQPEPLWSVRHVGGAMRGAGAEQLPAVVRPVLEAGISNNSLRFMYALGYKLDYEMLRTGFSFQMHKTVPIAVTITIAVTAVHRLPKTHAVDDAQPVTPNLHMVQLTAPASPDNYSDVVGAISGLAEYLAPLVHLSKPGVPAGIVPTASTAAAALVSRGGITKVL